MFGKCLLLVGLTIVTSVSARHVHGAPRFVENPNRFTELKKYATEMNKWALDVKKETENWKEHQVVKKLRVTVDMFMEDWQLKNPETTEDNEKYMEYIEKVEQGTYIIVMMIMHMGDTMESKNMKDLSAKLLFNAANTFVELAEENNYYLNRRIRMREASKIRK